MADEWSAKCPTCGARPSDACYGNGPMPRRMTHPARVSLSREAWLAAHDREVAERAWDEGFVAGVNADMGDYEHPPDIVTNPYREEADRG